MPQELIRYRIFLCSPVTQLCDSLSQVAGNPGTDKTAMDFWRTLPEIRWRSCLSPVFPLSALARAHDQHRHVQMMPHGTDSGAEDQVLESAVAVRAHDHQVGIDLLGVTQDFQIGR